MAFVEPTVLILGAGASVAYGYPVGSGLSRHIFSPMKSENFRDPTKTMERLETGFVTQYLPITQPLLEGNINLDDWKQFVIAFHRSSYETIDQFIGARPKFAPIGKILIAQKLLDCEFQWMKHARMYEDIIEPLAGKQPNDKPVDFWYKSILNHLVHPDLKQTQNLSIVTFNYDLSLQNAIHEHGLHAFGLNAQEAKSFVDSIPMVAVYGSVGSLNWQNAKGREYGSIQSPSSIVAAAQQITTIHEKQGQQSLNYAKSLIEKACFKFIFGFGFHAENCTRIGLDKFGESRVMGYDTPSMCATSCGMIESDRHSVNRKVKVTFDQPGEFKSISNYLRNCDSFRKATDVKLDVDPANYLPGSFGGLH